MCVWSTSWLGEALGVASAKVITRMHLINRITEKVSNVISNINIQSDRTICYGIGELVLWMWMTHSAHRTLSPWILSVCVWIGNRWAIKWQNWDHKYASYASFKWKSCHRTRKKVQNNKMKHRISFAHGAVVGVCICVCVCRCWRSEDVFCLAIITSQPFAFDARHPHFIMGFTTAVLINFHSFSRC